jgi:hypothetical protein
VLRPPGGGRRQVSGQELLRPALRSLPHHAERKTHEKGPDMALIRAGIADAASEQ